MKKSLYFFTFLTGLLFSGNANAQHEVVEIVVGIPGSSGFSGSDIPGIESLANTPLALDYDSQGNVYFAAVAYNRIMKYDVTTKLLSVVAGTGDAVHGPDGFNASTTPINGPGGIAIDENDNIFFTETLGQYIRYVSSDDNKIRTIMGTGVSGYNGSGGKGDTTQLSSPFDLDFDDQGNLYWIDAGHHLIRMWDPTDSVVHLIAGVPFSMPMPIVDGSGTNVQINPKGGITVNSDGSEIYFTTVENRIGKVTDGAGGTAGTINIVVGASDSGGYNISNGYGPDIELNGPFGLDYGVDGQVYFMEDNGGLLRSFDPSTLQVQLIAGIPESAGYNGNYLAPLDTEINGVGVVLVPNGDIYFADSGNDLVRRIFTCYNPEFNQIVANQDSYCPGDTVILYVDGDLNDGSDWEWYYEDCFVADQFVTSNDWISFVAGTETRDINVVGVSKTCTNDSTCHSFTIEIGCGAYSNSFTPNNDGVNDYFHIDLITNYPNNEVIFYNRYGEEIAAVDNYDNQENRWNGGVYNSEDIVPPGTYYFVFNDVNTSEAIISGWIQVIR